MKELNPSRYKNKVELENETVYEIVTEKDGHGWGLAIADIVSSELHVHNRTNELYTVLEGKLKLVMGGEERTMLPGSNIMIPLRVSHRAESLERKPARVAVLSFPAWTPEDHHIIKSS